MKDTNKLTGEQFTLAMFAIEEANRSIADQAAELDQIRSRALAQLGLVGTVVTFLFGAVLTTKPERDPLFYLFAVGLTVLAGMSIWATWKVWRTVKGWRIKIGATTIVENYANEPPTYSTIAELAQHYDSARENNERILEQKRTLFRYAWFWLAGTLTVTFAAMWALG